MELTGNGAEEEREDVISLAKLVAEDELMCPDPVGPTADDDSLAPVGYGADIESVVGIPYEKLVDEGRPVDKKMLIGLVELDSDDELELSSPAAELVGNSELEMTEVEFDGNGREVEEEA